MVAAKKTATSRRSTKATAEKTESASSKLVVVLEQTKVTKNFVRFDSPDEDSAVPSLYVSKAFADENTTSITVTLEK